MGDNVEQGVYPFAQALRMAEDQGLDLVEISASAVPIVCRIIEYKKFLYDLKKKQKEIKAKQATVEVKEIRFGPFSAARPGNRSLRLPAITSVACWYGNHGMSRRSILEP